MQKGESLFQGMILDKLDYIISELKLISHKESVMAGELDQLRQDVAKQKEVVAGVVTLLQGLKKQLDDAIAAGDMEAVKAIAADIEANNQTLADAVVANTPA